MTYSTLEYSVCGDCLLFIANVDMPEGVDPGFYEAAIAHELCWHEGHFALGVEPTDEDPEGEGYDEFSGAACELCRNHLAGSRHGVTLFIKEES